MNLGLVGILKNRKLMYSLFSQLITLGVSLMMTIGVSRFLSVENFGYWQLFIFYISYVGLAHFGICDGIYLKFGGKKIEELENPKMKGLFLIYLLFHVLICICILVYTWFSEVEYQRKFIFYAVAGILLINNVQVLLSYILLATNSIVENSKAVFIEKLTMLFAITTLVSVNKITFENLIYSYFFSKILSIFYYFKFFKKFKFLKYDADFNNLFEIIRVGFILMISNIVSTLIIGVSRYFIDHSWDIETFGKISLSISLVYFVLILLSQVSFIIFPYLRNISLESQKKTFINLNRKLSLLLKIVIITYIPLSFILHRFLPNYSESINYLILLLPICLFDGKMQILYISYFKNLLLQKKLLIINLITFFISFLLTLLGIYYYESIEFILIGTVISLMLRSIISEISLLHTYNIKKYSNLIIDVIFSLIIFLFYFNQDNILGFIKTIFN